MSIYRTRIISYPHQTSPVHPPSMRTSEPTSPRRKTSNLLSSPRGLPSISSPRPQSKHPQYMKEISPSSPRYSTKENIFKPFPSKENPTKILQNEVLSHITYCTTVIVPTSQKEMDEKIFHLTEIQNFISKAASQTSLISTILHDFFYMISANLFRPIRGLSPFLLYSDSKAYITQPLWPMISLIHNILLLSIKKLKVTEIAQFINHSFITKLIELFITPDLTERASLEVIVSVIFDKFPKQRSYMFHRVVQMCNGFLENTRIYTCVPPCIRFIHNYLRLCPQTKVDISQLTQSLIAPLFSKNFSAEYFEDLQNFSIFVCEGDTQLTIWLLQYLIMHYPMTDSTKQCYFIQIFLVLTRILPCNGAAHVASQVFSLIADAIVSDNFRVSLCALELIQNQCFMHQFSTYSAAIIRTIVPCLKITKNHWCDMVRDATNEAMRAMRNFDKSVDRIVEKNDHKAAKKNREAYNIWAQILHSADKSIDTGDKERVSKNLSLFATTIGIR